MHWGRGGEKCLPLCSLLPLSSFKADLLPIQTSPLVLNTLFATILTLCTPVLPLVFLTATHVQLLCSRKPFQVFEGREMSFCLFVFLSPTSFLLMMITQPSYRCLHLRQISHRAQVLFTCLSFHLCMMKCTLSSTCESKSNFDYK